MARASDDLEHLLECDGVRYLAIICACEKHTHPAKPPANETIYMSVREEILGRQGDNANAIASRAVTFLQGRLSSGVPAPQWDGLHAAIVASIGQHRAAS